MIQSRQMAPKEEQGAVEGLLKGVYDSVRLLALRK